VPLHHRLRACAARIRIAVRASGICREIWWLDALGNDAVFFVALAASNLSRQSIALVSILIAICVELFRLVHLPWLDQFRLTLPGALLLGRIFSTWNMFAYGVGIGLAILLDRLAMRAFTEAKTLD
jgi:hypothetical protein